MNTLSSNQLIVLTNRINARLSEFGEVFEPTTPGVVRLAHDVIEQWRCEEVPPATVEAVAMEAAQEEKLALPAKDLNSFDPIQELASVPPVAEPYRNGHATSIATQPVTKSVATTLGPEHTVVTPLKEGSLPTRGMLVEEVKRQAMGGVMPTMDAFNMARPALWATAQAHLTRLDLSWGELAQEAGLALKRAK